MTFETYADALDWIRDRQAALGKRAFTATEEYRAAFPQIAALYERDHPDGRKRGNRRTATAATGAPANLLAHSLRRL